MDSILHSPFCNASLLAGLLFLFMGHMIRRYPPRSMKTWYGYRTFSSTINQGTWDEGNRYAAYFSRRLGWFLLPYGILMGVVFHRQSDLFLYLTVTPVIVGALLLTGFTEWRLLQLFDEDGAPRKKDGGNQKPAA